METIRYFYQATTAKAKALWTFVQSEEFLDTSKVSKNTIHSGLYFGIAGLYLCARMPMEAWGFRMVAELLAYILISWGLNRVLGGISSAQAHAEFLQEQTYILLEGLHRLKTKVEEKESKVVMGE